MAALRFSPASEERGIRLSLMRREGLLRKRDIALPVEAWWEIAEPTLAPALARLRAWLDDEQIEEAPTSLLLPHPFVADLTVVEADRLGLPPAPSIALQVKAEGTLNDPGFALRHAWRTLGGRPIIGVGRQGAWLETPDGPRRLPRPLFNLAEAIDHFASLAPANEAERWRAWQRLRAALPEDADTSIEADPYLTSITLAYAGRFSLEPFAGADGFDFDPVLYAPASTDDDPASLASEEPAPLLPPALHKVFAEKRFRVQPMPQAHYTLDQGQYLVLDPDIETALKVVRQAQRGDRATRQAFARNPAGALKTALGGELSEDALEILFVETAGYSQRVKDLGIWTSPVLPWVKREGGKWFPDDPSTWPPAGLRVGDRFVTVPPEDVPDLIEKVAGAMRAGEPAVDYESPEGAISLPPTSDVLESLRSLPGAERHEAAKGDSTKGEPEQRRVLLIEDNLETLDYQGSFAPREEHGATHLPSAIRCSLKPHQRDGVAWLERAWRQGAPGVLLADDMGLGKTVQALAFLDFVRRVGICRKKAAPFLIVAPTSLLGNWEKEHEEHLEAPGLGAPLRLWGAQLRHCRRADTGRLDTEKLSRADWFLTSYETMRDHHQELGVIRFAAIVFDEAQKLKNPGALVSYAAKSLNTDFILALTGTPIENRLADLWTIADLAHPGLLGELKSFSQSYEAPDTPPERLQELKESITRPGKERQPFMLRRMKDDHLPGLPDKSIRLMPKPMPAEQQDAYAEALAWARAGGKGDVLRALQRIRGISLHPRNPADTVEPFEDFAQRSARWQALLQILDTIAERREKVLVFCESLAAQPVLAGLAKERYKLTAQPKRINGETPGPSRSQAVEAFQNAPSGFDLMILGPKSAGVGLTLTAANHVVHLSRWWNPAVEDQCTDRVHRIGQNRPVTVWIPQAIFPPDRERSFDLRLEALLERKRHLSREMLAPPAASMKDAEDLLRSTLGA